MRIRIPRRILLLGLLLTALVLVSTSAPSTYAKPMNWNDPTSPTPSGDGDGSVVKAAAFGTTTTTSSAASVWRATQTTRLTGQRLWDEYLLAMRLGYGWRLFWW